MIKSDLIQKIYTKNPHLYQQDLDRVVNTVLNEITKALKDGFLVSADNLVDQQGWALASGHALFPIAWQTVGAVCQGPFLHTAQNCANLQPNRPVIRWMSVHAALHMKEGFLSEAFF